jgi:hypothetical protein
MVTTVNVTTAERIAKRHRACIDIGMIESGSEETLPGGCATIVRCDSFSCSPPTNGPECAIGPRRATIAPSVTNVAASRSSGPTWACDDGMPSGCAACVKPDRGAAPAGHRERGRVRRAAPRAGRRPALRSGRPGRRTHRNPLPLSGHQASRDHASPGLPCSSADSTIPATTPAPDSLAAPRIRPFRRPRQPRIPSPPRERRIDRDVAAGRTPSRPPGRSHPRSTAPDSSRRPPDPFPPAARRGPSPPGSTPSGRGATTCQRSRAPQPHGGPHEQDSSCGVRVRRHVGTPPS